MSKNLGRKTGGGGGGSQTEGCGVGGGYTPLQKWIAAVCVLHMYCVQRNTHAECTCAKCAQIAHVHTKYVLLVFVLYVYIL